jgi:serine/threonine-protein kinase
MVGRELAHYRLIEQIGEGGMGVVWKAQDTTLDREVAVKILPDLFANDPDRLARFEREAKLLASLTHPNIAAIYGLHEADGVRFLAMEYVAGEDLGQRLGRGALPVQEALNVGIQVARALEAAHDSGVIHRDLKPANIQVTSEGQVKVLDFGLAKAFETDPASRSDQGSAHSPTLTSAGTRAGVILGTAAYMSPEQARGKPLDKRTDNWSFGCVIYECLTGRKAFEGETVSDSLAAILRAEPDWSLLPGETPRRIRELLQRCLAKDPKERLRDIGDARLDLERVTRGKEWETPSATAGAESVAERRYRPGWLAAVGLVAGLLLGAAAGIGVWNARTASAAPVSRLTILTPPGTNAGYPIISPDGSRIAYIDLADRRLHTRRLDRYDDVSVPGSEQVQLATFSPDSRWLAFVAPVSTVSRLFKAPADGSAPPVAIGDWLGALDSRLVWLTGGEVIGLTDYPRSIVSLPMDGSPPGQPIEVRAEQRDMLQLYMSAPLPDGRHVLVGNATYEERIWQPNVMLLDTETGELRRVIDDGTWPSWSPTGHLLFTRRATLLAVPFDLQELRTTGSPIGIIDDVRTTGTENWYGGWYGLSGNGALIYQPGGEVYEKRRLVFVDREGQVEPWSAERRLFEFLPAVSPDGSRIAVVVANMAEALYEIWASDIESPRLRPLVDEPALDCSSMAWVDSERLAYNCSGRDGGGIYLRRFDGTDEPELLVSIQRGEDRGVSSASPDGHFLVTTGRFARGGETQLLPINPGPDNERKLVTLMPGSVDATALTFSPDGRWIAYGSGESGRMGTYVRTIDPGGRLGPKFLVAEGTELPVWSRTAAGDKLELVYLQGSDVMAVSIGGASRASVGEPRRLFDAGELRLLSVAALPDGRWLAIQRSEEEAQERRIRIVQNWFDELRRLVPAR